jgi:hypothetical protein
MEGRLTVRTAMGILVVLAFAAFSPSQAQLIGVDAMAVMLHNGHYVNNYVFAYEDGQVWAGFGGNIGRIEAIDRGVRVRKMIPCNNGSILIILFVDDQVGTYMFGGGGFSIWVDAHRAGAAVTDMTLSPTAQYGCDNLWLTYDDGQIYLYSGGSFTRMAAYERLDPTSTVDEPNERIDSAAFPNPSSGACRIALPVGSEGPASADVLDASGRIVRRLLDGPHPAGDYSLEWDGKDDAGRELPAGVYFTHVTTAQGTTTGRVVLAR